MKVRKAPSAATTATLRITGCTVRVARVEVAVISRFANCGRPPFTTTGSVLTEIAENNRGGHGSLDWRKEALRQEARMNRTTLLKSIAVARLPGGAR